jgi:hypothetical protein
VRCRTEIRDGQERKHRGHDGHVPATRTSWLLAVIFQRTVAVIDSMLVNGTVCVDVRDDVALGMLVKRMSVTIAVVVVAVYARSSLRDERPLKRKRQRRRHHDDIDAPAKKGSRTRTQLHAPESVSTAKPLYTKPPKASIRAWYGPARQIIFPSKF